MLKAHIVIYIPGLGDQRVTGQKWALRLWYLYGVWPRLHRIQWHDQQPFDAKAALLLKEIDVWLDRGYHVSLVAASAGASAALYAYAARPEQLSGVALICGKVHGHYGTNNAQPSFGQALEGLPAVLASLDKRQRRRIMSAHPRHDEQVPVAQTQLAGALERTMPVDGHFWGIAYGLTIYAPILVRFLKRQTRRHEK